MNSIANSILRRFSSNASTIVELESHRDDPYQSTLTSVTPCRQCDNEMMAPLLPQHFNWPMPPTQYPSPSSSTYYLAPDSMDEAEVDNRNTFPSMPSICPEEDPFYPLERQCGQIPSYINRSEVYTRVDAYSNVATITKISESKERPIQKMSRRVSIVGRNASKQARKLSGELVRKGGKILSLNKAPDLIRMKQRTAMDEEMNWLTHRQVDLGREVDPDDNSQKWRRNIETDFRIVEWTASVEN
ncbi:uncharacterized protein PV09_01595 [Verruconis gallopava]|uniref:Uncharacterized protein n=1 Tax=Verruconis gallopava TaxID=253628 RepID=A0A0D2ALK9_9PEZI|nr:uncharacterized protein PV09_01595 [Verruconis gallopava]KIW07653.1 hypothetical protein PV09_01595 [Verruconis gallopava]